MSSHEHEERIRANVRVALQRYMHVLIEKHEGEQDGLLRDLLWAEMRELDYWYCQFVENEDVSLYSLAERKAV